MKNILTFIKLIKICKYMRIQTETTKSLFNDSCRYLKLHIIEVSKKNMLFHTLHSPSYNCINRFKLLIMKNFIKHKISKYQI